MGRLEARLLLLRLLREEPTAAMIAAIPGIPDVEGIVLLGRIARIRPDLAEAAIDSLKEIDAARSVAIVAAISGLRQTGC
jgi:hypothetical protein